MKRKNNVLFFKDENEFKDSTSKNFRFINEFIFNKIRTAYDLNIDRIILFDINDNEICLIKEKWIEPLEVCLSKFKEYEEYEKCSECLSLIKKIKRS